MKYKDDSFPFGGPSETWQVWSWLVPGLFAFFVGASYWFVPKTLPNPKGGFATTTRPVSDDQLQTLLHGTTSIRWLVVLHIVLVFWLLTNVCLRSLEPELPIFVGTFVRTATAPRKATPLKNGQKFPDFGLMFTIQKGSKQTLHPGSFNLQPARHGFFGAGHFEFQGLRVL